MTQQTSEYQKPALTRIGTMRELTQQIVLAPCGHTDTALCGHEYPTCSAR